MANPGRDLEQRRPFADEEPTADMRTFASGLRSMFVALVQEGFNERQALTVMGQALAASIQKPKDED